MFAVPGWAVSATSLVSERDSTAHSSSVKDSSASTSKKRKHAQPRQDHSSKISGSELEKLWNKHNTLKPVSQPKDHGKAKKRTSEGDKTARSGKDGAKNHETKTIPSVKTEGQRTHKVDPASSKNPSAKSQHDIQAPRRSDKPKTSSNSRDKTSNNRRNHDAENPARDAQAQPDASSTTAKGLSQLHPSTVFPTTKLTPLQAKMRSKLTSARFRHLNETLYTTSSASAMDLFSSSPDLFAEYHAGFSQQVKDSWPQNPVDLYITSIKTRGTLASPQNGVLPIPRRKTGSCTIADLGCGDAPLARGCQALNKSLKLKFHNFDLHSPNTLVTKADISNLPLRDGEADIAVFCLSLMGTNWVSFVEEAWRILRGDGKGEVWVAEVKSRFGRAGRGPGPRVVENSVGKRRKTQRPKDDGHDDGVPTESFVEEATGPQDDTDISAFVKVFARRGFQLREESVDKSNKMFVTMIFIKSGIPTAGKHQGLKWNGHEYQKQHDGKMRFSGGQGRDDDVSPEDEAKVLKPCVYKTR
ncbi:hypothetical protein PV10_06894 [Exophiala mesophila]|uniref:Ribosomal RNA-processing protein 8 n=1 Tax=Exophiala mesophila TaxID=212818 RepID=A0A0D1XN19_EXOME|nr:uncharacterized protein PV10_06894 [Exophiala mesophila]KIV89501.1 hypothetical protein PV10_06894 [Exophiala mesophila]